jgi:DNA-directed RNA polymerase omega subunit
MVKPQMIYPETDELSQYPRYVLALLTARRAQMLRAGAEPLVVADSDNLLSIALEEIAQGKIRPRVLSPEEVEVEIVDQRTLGDIKIERQPALGLDEVEQAVALTDLPSDEQHNELDVLASEEEDDILDIPEADALTDEDVAKLSDMLARQEALVSEELKKEQEKKTTSLSAVFGDDSAEEEMLAEIEEDGSLAENG